MMGTPEQHDKYLILMVEESASSLGFYDSETGNEVGRVELSLWPHEISVSSDGLAYVSNFGVRDYDLSLGHAGNSISIVDTKARCEVGRLITQTENEHFWGPHGVKLSSDEAHVYVNVERVVGIREPDLNRPGSEYTKLLKFKRETGECVETLEIPLASFDRREVTVSKFGDESLAYDVLPGTHNFVFSPHDPNELWLFSGKTGVSIIDVSTGKIIARMQDFNGAVRSLAFGDSGTLLVSATNEVSLVDPKKRQIIKKIGGFGVGQILYSKLTPDEKYILAPAVWEGQILVIDVQKESVAHRLNTGIDPVQVMIAPDKQRAYVTHGRSRWLSYIELTDLSKVAGRIATRGGPNGTAFSTWSPAPKRGLITFATCLPFTGRYSVEGREMRLGYQQWKDTVNGSGGLVIGGQPHKVEIVFADTASSIDEVDVRALAATLIDQSTPLAVLGSFPLVTDRWLGMVANEREVTFVTGFGRDPVLFDGTHQFVFGMASQVSCELESVLLALKHGVSPRPVTVAVLAADEDMYIVEAAATVKFATATGFQIVSTTGADSDGIVRHPPGETDLTAIMRPIRDMAPDLLLIVSDRRDSVVAVRACEDIRFRPGGIGLSCGITNAGFTGKLGTMADGLLGGVEWSNSVFLYSEDRFGSGEDYNRIYFDRYSEAPSLYAAAGSAVGIVLERAIHCGCSSPKDLVEYLRALQFSSFYGDVTFGKSGRNTAKSSYGIQLRLENGALREIPLWPRNISEGQRPRWPFR